MSIIPEQIAFMKDQVRLVSFVFNHEDMECVGGDLWRRAELQKWFIEQGLSQTKHSQHANRTAIDLVFFDKGKYDIRIESFARIEPIGLYWESLDPKNQWGALPKGDLRPEWDLCHFQRTV